MKTFIITPCFAKSTLVSDFLAHFYAAPPRFEFTHALLLNHYPVNREQNNEEIKKLAQLYDCTLVDTGGDLGLHRSLNHAVEKLGIGPMDLVIGHDPDDRCSPGALDAIRDVMCADPLVAVCGLNFSVIQQKGPYPESAIAGHRVWVHPSVEMFNVVGWNMSLIHAAGGFSQPNSHYGGIEIALYPEWVNRGMKLVYLIDHTSDYIKVDRNDSRLFDQSYHEWKVAHGFGKFKGNFDEWLVCK
jgi:hypothetical protein